MFLRKRVLMGKIAELKKVLAFVSCEKEKTSIKKVQLTFLIKPKC